MPDIVIAGATFNGVPSIDIPKSGGGTASFFAVDGSQTVTQNGTYDVSALEQMIVNVSGGGGGGGLEYETGTYVPESDIERPTISFAKEHSETPFFVAMSDVNDSGVNANSSIVFCFFDPYRLFGIGYPYSTSALRSAMAYYSSRSSTSGATNAGVNVTYNSDNTTDTDQSYSRYWVKPNSFRPRTASSKYWRAGRTYKWIAVWKPAT